MVDYCVNLCIVAPFRVLPPASGSPRRVFEISASLCRAGVSVFLIHAGLPQTFQSGLRVMGYSALENFPFTGSFPWAMALDSYLASLNPALCRLLLSISKKVRIDVLQVEGPWTVSFSGLIKVMRKSENLPIIYDAHNVESISVRYSSRLPWIWPYAVFAERRTTAQSEAVLCVSEVDKTAMCKLHGLPSSKVAVVPNGVDNSRFRLDSRVDIRRRLGLNVDTKIVFFQGALRWKPNFEAAQTIVESIAPKFENDSPDTVFLIADSVPHPPRRLLNRATRRHNVRILGYVPRIEEWICASDVCIAPMKTGSGTKTKILEYCAAGRPIVATTKAVEGMGIRNGREALLFDDVDEDFVDAIKVVSAADVSQSLGRNAKNYARLFDWKVIAGKLINVYESVLNRGTGQSVEDDHSDRPSLV